MKYLSVAVAIVLSACLSIPAFCQDQGGRGGRGGNRPNRDQNQPGAPVGQGMGQGMGQGGMGMGRGGMGRMGFILSALNDLPDMVKAVQEHNDILKGLQVQLMELRMKTLDELIKTENPQEREKITGEARGKAIVLLGLVVDEAIRHDRVVADIVEKHKDEIVQKAAEQVFAGRRFGRGGQQPAPAANEPAPPPTPEPAAAPAGDAVRAPEPAK